MAPIANFAFYLLLLLTVHSAAQEGAVSKGVTPVRQIDPMVSTTIEHYEIRGVSFDDIRHELRAKGYGGAGSTSGEVTYRFKSQRVNGVCGVAEVRASCTTKVRLPRWYDVSKAPAEAQAIWKEAYEKLRKHEMGHVHICVEVAREVEEALWSTPAAQYCDEVEREARNRADKLVRGMDARQVAFDVREYGGATARK